jgi:hypothetical protein
MAVAGLVSLFSFLLKFHFRFEKNEVSSAVCGVMGFAAVNNISTR